MSTKQYENNAQHLTVGKKSEALILCQGLFAISDAIHRLTDAVLLKRGEDGEPLHSTVEKLFNRELAIVRVRLNKPLPHFKVGTNFRYAPSTKKWQWYMGEENYCNVTQPWLDILLDNYNFHPDWFTRVS